MAEKSGKMAPHGILIAFPLQGHINPMIQLAIKLASKGITITVVHTESVHHQTISHSSQTNAAAGLYADLQKSGLDIRCSTVGDGLPLDFDRSNNVAEYWEHIMVSFPALVDEFVGDMIRSHPFSSFFMVADTFFLWPPSIAEKYNVVCVSFWTETALVFSLFYHLDLLTERGHFPSTGKRDHRIDYIPGIGEIALKDLPSQLQTKEALTMDIYAISEAFREVKKTELILCNTVPELETETISALQQKLPVHAIGLIFPAAVDQSMRVPVSLWRESDCAHWLSTKPPGSVMYLSFGTLAQIGKDVFPEIAHGLRESGINFIWVLGPRTLSSGDPKNLPAGFEESVVGRGIIVPWCCQMEVLSHPATGGFLTHCGWNSVLESIWCGVPLLCYPVLYDQISNRKLAVDDWKIGINLCESGSNVTRGEARENINRLMSGKKGEELRKEMKKVRATVRNSMATDGSSERNFNQFVEDLKLKINSRLEHAS